MDQHLVDNPLKPSDQQHAAELHPMEIAMATHSVEVDVKSSYNV